MSVAMWNCQSWELNVSTRGYIWQPFWGLHLTSDLGHFIWQVGRYNWLLIWVLHLTSHLGHFIWQMWGYIWLSWTLHLEPWPAKMCLNNNIAYNIWKIWGLMIEISVAMSVAMWNCHSWPLEVSSSVKLLMLTTRCQYQCLIGILDH